MLVLLDEILRCELDVGRKEIRVETWETGAFIPEPQDPSSI
jgi:hypothetical protein